MQREMTQHPGISVRYGRKEYDCCIGRRKRRTHLVGTTDQVHIMFLKEPRDDVWAECK